MLLLTASQSRELDRLSQEKYGVDSYALMTNAGEAVARAIARRWPDAIARGVLVVAGKGNNGGDGFVVARRLRRGGEAARVLLLSRIADLKGDAARAFREFAAEGGAVNEIVDEKGLSDAFGQAPAGVIVDAVFGTGLNAEVRGLARHAIDAINAADAPVAAVDIPSGVNSDTGAVMGVAVRATVTITFGFAKYGHASYPGAEFCGCLEIAEIGFAREAIGDIAPRGRLIEHADATTLIRPRGENTHKGTYGHPLIIAGSRGKSGAAVLVARGALRAGAGLVTAAIPESVAAIVAAGQAELMTEPMPDHEGHFEGASSIERIAELAQGKSVLIAGPGMGTSEDTRLIVEWLAKEGTRPDRPLLLDADALNVLARISPTILKSAKGPVVLTPHPGEMARLLAISTSEVNADRISAARRLAEVTGAGVLLKGARSVMVTPELDVFVNSSGNPGMATPGMGDVLSGIIGALIGQGISAGDALKAGVFMHGHAADRLAARIGPAGYLAGELADELPSAMVAR
ncbi:MAG TPA: NAD(P)H-hydrate dehydratase [Candidatus Binataceae bacterium]|nr:NAD(P)H-hydrate dehydratase [Candidatus Binataceae bacterium]